MSVSSIAWRVARLALAWAALGAAAHAADVSFDVQPRVLQLGESAICSITIHGGSGTPAPRLPAISGFDVVPAGTEQSISITPAGRTISVTHKFQLTPMEAGTFQIGPFAYNLGQQNVTLPAVEIKVVPATSGDAAAPAAQRWSDLLFATLTSDRPEVYVQETFDIVLKVYSQGLNLDRQISLTDLRTTGLNLGSFEEMGSGREIVSNQVFDVRQFRARATALTAGTFTLTPRLRVNVLVPRQRSRDPFWGDNPFESMFFGRVEARAVDLEARPQQFTVAELPSDGRPSGFSGAVGRYTFDVQVQPTELRVGDPVTITMRVTGDGNMDTVSPPAMVLGPAFKSYDAKLLQQDPAAGQKTFEMVVIPKSPDASELPPLSFSYFDPQRRAYETIVRGPFALTVKPASAEAALVVQGTPRPSIVIPESLGSDIIYLQPAPRRWTNLNARPWYRHPALLCAQVIPAFALAAIFLVARRRDELARDHAKARRQEAPRSARAALVRAEHVLKHGTAHEFLEAVWLVLVTYFANRFNLAPGQVTRDEVCLRLHRSGLAPAHLEDLRTVFDVCEDERFAATWSGGQALTDQTRKLWTERLDRISEILRACERLKL